MNKIFNFFDLHEGEDKRETVLDNVIKNISFRGANAWILACAIVIASVGLNVNSTAVIIGAMLISPLMGPIVGAGFALGTFDFPLLKKSIKNLLIATMISLIVSFVYFLLSPFKEAQSELLARTSPNIYDVLIAIFGGLVGVIAITRVDKGNPIPGVAIATALMPPLCTAGYGLAIGNMSYFAGALYLYIINCVFICIATFAIVKYLRYPKVHYVDQKREKRITQSITLITLVLVLPSLYFAYNLLKEKKYTTKVKEFVQTEFSNKGFTVIYEKLHFKSNPKKLELAFLTKKFSDEELTSLKSSMETSGIENTELVIHQDSFDLKSTILSEIDKRSNLVNSKDLTISELNNELARFQLTSPQLNQDVKVLFPELSFYSIGLQQHYAKADSVGSRVVFIYSTSEQFTEAQKSRLHNWLKNHFPRDSVEVINRPEYTTSN
ncbi:TIGR00341 family protein [Sphingobacterium hungaricum]|uniref:TIGR00341 family protein n=1 Tax=Sphingobacterium hungaricum TaxID=2082723 RepID=A0A928UY04_9SPHI|nr:TIGR00341 family protein [Sphingobacterium hungaricum]MBE8712654.1 TIGR00341 family protein [Sphingobacterium hungaricum]